ncbi:MAG TPA: transposase [Gaiellaceae bacterium]|nr:transposase [Gaiellaceae bacterium]
MGRVRGQAATLQVEMVCLDELVAEDDRYRKLDRLVDWSFVREVAAPYYAEDVGRPSIDPIVLVKLMVAGALEGIGSTRELLRQASVRLDLRRFLGYGLAERLPVHQTLSHAHTRRFVDAALFERLFLRSLELCKQHGLVEGTHISIDGFHAEADAALASLRASLALAAAPQVEAAGEAGPSAASASAAAGQLALEEQPAGGEPGGERPALRLAEPRSGPTPKRRSSNRTSVSVTDPEAKLRGKPGQRPHLVYRGQVAVDRKQRVIVACLGEQADGFEGDAVEPLLDRARFALPELESVGADSGFAAERVWRGAARRGIAAFIPPQPTMLPKAGEEATTDAQRQALAARARCKSPTGIAAHRQRMADAEGVIGELKNQGTADRAQRRGRPHYHVQLLLNCAAVNCKRLADHAPQAQSGVAAAPQTTQAQQSAPAASATSMKQPAAADRSRWLAQLLAAAPCAWDYTTSLN